MAKRRFNAKKIANTPSLKKRMAKFCAFVEVKWSKPDYEEMMYKGHRGFISFSEDDLAKEFDKRLQIIRDKYGALKVNDDEDKNRRFYRKSDELVELELWYEEAVTIANEIFEEQFFA